MLAAEREVFVGLFFPVRTGFEGVRKVMSKETRKQTILLVDDQEQDRRAVRGILEKRGYMVLEAADYWDAVQIHQQRQSGIQLLLTAIALPGNNGYELARTLFRADPDLKVLFVSGPTGAEVSRFYNMPVTGPHMLTKPVNAEEAIRRVKGAIRSRRRRFQVKSAG